MGDTRQAGPHEAAQRTAQRDFLDRESAKVYLLLDFLSGRTDRSLRPTPEEQGRALLDQRTRLVPAGDAQADDDKEQARIERDLTDPTRLVSRTVRIRYSIEPTGNSFHADATFLVRAHDMLNARAAPASSATIAFTSMVFAQSQRDTQVPDAVAQAFPGFQAPARALTRWINALLKMVLPVVLLFSLCISAYVAWGKIMLDTIDAVRRDDGAIRQQLVVARTTANLPATSHVCTGKSDDPAVCTQQRDLLQRQAAAFYQLGEWERGWLSGSYKVTEFAPPKDTFVLTEAQTLQQKDIEVWSTAEVSAIGNYLMPILYGILGSMAFVLRRHHDRLAASLLKTNELRDIWIRMALGALIGSCIGLFYSGTSAAQTNGILGAAVTLSTAAIAFLAGYGVEAVFKMFDALIANVFRVNGTDQPAR